MKILQIVTQMEAGGAQRVAHLLQQEFEARGHTSELLFLYVKRPAYASARNTSSLMSHPPTAIGYVRILVRLAKLLRSQRPDVVITHTHYAAIMGATVAKLAGVSRRLAVLHNPVNTFPSLARIADYVLGSTGIYTHTVAVSQTVAASVAAYPRPYRKRLSVIYNGIPEPAIPPARDVIRKQQAIPLNATLLVNVGRFSHQKNQAFLLHLLAKNKALHLLLVGDGELRYELQSQIAQLGIQDRVHVTGEVTSAEVNAFVACSDVFVLPSLFEAVGMVVLEAMALGVPVLASDIPSSHEFLGEDGFIADLATPEVWLAFIACVKSEPDRVREMVARARLKVQEFTVQRMAERYESVLVNSEQPVYGLGRKMMPDE